MNLLGNFINEDIISAAGWAIINPLWQGTIIAALLGILLLFMRKSNSRIRGLLAYGALIIIFTSTAVTFVDHYKGNTVALNEFTINENLEKITTNFSLPSLFGPETGVSDNNQSVVSSFLNLLNGYFNEHLPLIVSIWLLGMVFFSLKLLGGFVYTQRLKHYRTSQVQLKFQNFVDELCDLLEIDKKVKILESAFVKIPVVIGHFKPVILFPLGLVSGLPQNQVEAIIMHELAHIKRADYLLNIFQSFIEVILFYHPAVWWISSVIRDERENSCDDLATELCEDELTLAKALINVNQFGNPKQSVALAAIGNKNQLLKRIKRMVRENKEISLTKRISSAVLLVIFFLSVIFVACSSGNEAIDNTSGEEPKSEEVVNEIVDKEDDVIMKVIEDKDYVESEPEKESEAMPEEEPEIWNRNTIKYYEDGVQWRVKLEDGKIKRLYKDGERVPDNDIHKYEDTVYERLDEIKKGMKSLKTNLKELAKNKKEIKFDVSELKESLKHVKELNKHKINKEMEHLVEELAELKEHKIKFEFDNQEFKEHIEELKENLQDLKIDVDFDLDLSSLKSDMATLKKNLNELKIDFSDFDMSDFHVDMEQLGEEMEDLKIDMGDLKVELRKLKNFTKEMKSELVYDGYLDDEDEDFSMKFSKNKLMINGERLPDSLLEKYRAIYKKHFDKEIDDENTIIFD